MMGVFQAVSRGPDEKRRRCSRLVRFLCGDVSVWNLNSISVKKKTRGPGRIVQIDMNPCSEGEAELEVEWMWRRELIPGRKTFSGCNFLSISFLADIDINYYTKIVN